MGTAGAVRPGSLEGPRARRSTCIFRRAFEPPTATLHDEPLPCRPAADGARVGAERLQEVARLGRERRAPPRFARCETPDGFTTPVYPALGGAILKAIDVAAGAPTEASAVLLVTDGVPQGPAATCGGVNPEDPQVIADLAATGLGYGVPTYVVGLPGVNQAFANLVAAAGGTDAAILVSTADVAGEFQQALAKVSGDAVPCSYDVPEQVTSGELELGLVNIEVTPTGGGDPYTIPKNQDCDGAGWRYDDPIEPTEILLCPASCDALEADSGAAIRVVLGCASVLQ